MGPAVAARAKRPTGVSGRAAVSYTHLDVYKRQDLDEVFRLSDRVITMYEGRITGEFSAAEISREEIGYCMTGGRREEAQA